VGKENARYIHMGLTSSDVIDTAFALQIKDSSEIILKDLDGLIETLKNMAVKYKDTICIGRSHGVHAEVLTFGFKLLNWYDELLRAKQTFLIALQEISVGQSGIKFSKNLNTNYFQRQACKIYICSCTYNFFNRKICYRNKTPAKNRSKRS